MKANEAFIFFLFELIPINAQEDWVTLRSAYFKTWENKRLRGHVVQRFKSPSLISCSHSCLNNAWCTSVNFEEKQNRRVCELNKHKISLVLNEEKTFFHDETGVTFCIPLKGCLLSGCVDGGTCLVHEMKQTFSCQCKAPWTGTEYRMVFPEPLSTDSYALKANAILTDLSNFTMCCFVKRVPDNDSRHKYCFFSYAKHSFKGNDLLICIFSDGVTFYVDDTRVDTHVDVVGGDWYHLCLTWENTQGLYKLYKDGALATQGTGISTGFTIKPGGTAVLGQDQDTVGGGFKAEDAFVGEVTQLNLWDRVLSEIVAQYRKCPIPHGSVIEWTVFRGRVHGNVRVVEP